MLPQIATVNDRIINSPSCQISRDQIDKKYLRWWILTKKWHPFKETILRPYTHKVSRISKSFSWTTTWELFPDSSLSLSNHNATRNKSDQRFIYNVETNFVRKKMLLIQMAAMLITQDSRSHWNEIFPRSHHDTNKEPDNTVWNENKISS